MPRNPAPVGAVFVDLTVLALSPLRIDKKPRWECRCTCGVVKTYDAYNIKSGHTTSCGCRQVDRGRAVGLASKTHGHSKVAGVRPSATYRTWQAMVQRTTNPNMIHFKNYGGRGISMCKAWRDSFASFLNDMGERPPGRSIDRIDNRFGYFMANCRWATPREQVLNRRCTIC